ncbi:MAG: hypothetical protein A3F72_17815 [Bacteroidetes bacterium RIFCSPLOWO2_12_FULL_35_15]|nr:MAG: hypothetical protein A3F72_17815 [Bacteroidetes bacterium RIFCSPLOWO2_12_FULL_35_15]
MAKKLYIFFLLFPFLSIAQKDVTQGLVLPVTPVLVRAVVYEGDTIPYVTLSPVICSSDRVFKNKRQKASWDRLKYNVKIVYPYAILAAAKLKEYDKILAQIPDEKDRLYFTKLAEKQLKEQFGEELKNLTITQGRILIKLIDRETGATTYKVVKSMRGSFSAFMWQGVAVMFNSSLKEEYDAAGEDKGIEQAIRLIEAGDF